METTSPGPPRAAPLDDEPEPTSSPHERPAARTWWAAALEWVCLLCADFDD